MSTYQILAIILTTGGVTGLIGAALGYYTAASDAAAERAAASPCPCASPRARRVPTVVHIPSVTNVDDGIDE